MKHLKIGLLGFGTVGKGVFELINKQADIWKSRNNICIEIIAIGVKHPEKHERIKAYLVDPYVLVNDPLIDIIIEAISEDSLFYLLAALKKRKSVITANKKTVADNFDLLAFTADRFGALLKFDSAVCGGIPIFELLDNLSRTQNIISIRGVLNATSNLVLTYMEKGISLQNAVLEAQTAGLAEEDVSSDLDGFDTAYKSFIIVKSLGYSDITFEDIKFTGINDISSEKIERSTRNQSKIKLVCEIHFRDKIEIEIKPEEIKQDDPLYYVNNALNGIVIKGTALQDLILIGPGAGKFPTANSVLTDLLSLINHFKHEKIDILPVQN